MIPVGGPTTASLDRPGDALLADPAEPVAGQSADPRDDQPSGSVFDQPALPRLDQSAESRLDRSAGSLLDPAAKPQLDRAAEPRLDPAPGSLFVPAPKPRLDQSTESRSDPVAGSLADPAAEFRTGPTAEPWLDLVPKSLLMPPVSTIEPGSDDRTEPNRTEQTQISPAEYAPTSLTKPTQAEPAETRPAEAIPTNLTEPAETRSAETRPAETTQTSRTEPTEAGQNEPVPVGGSSVAAVSSYPVPAWLIRQNVARTSTGKAIVALTAMTLLALVLLGATVTLAMHGLGSDAAEDAPAPAGQLVQPAPAVAGGLPQHYAAEHNPVTQAIIAHFRQRFGVVFADPAAEVAGLYSQPGRVDVVTGLPAWVMYLGVNVSTSPGDLPAAVTGMMTSLDGPAAHVLPWRVAAGPAGGIAECVVTVIAKTQMSICGWATDSAIGALASPTRDTSIRELEVLMSQMRLDLQPN